jgi:hypothetical protein
LLVARNEGVRGRDRLVAFFGMAFFALVRVLMALLALVVELAFLGLAFLALVRVLAALPAERPRAGFSGVVSGTRAVADLFADCALPRPSPRLLAS